MATSIPTLIVTNLVLTSKVENKTKITILADDSIRIKELSGFSESTILIPLIQTWKTRLEIGR